MKSWQFGEHLWARLRNNRRIHIDLDEIDGAADEISFLVRDTYLKKALKEVDIVVLEHLMTDEVIISTEPG